MQESAKHAPRGWRATPLRPEIGGQVVLQEWDFQIARDLLR
jgi:hypothetical protein